MRRGSICAAALVRQWTVTSESNIAIKRTLDFRNGINESDFDEPTSGECRGGGVGAPLGCLGWTLLSDEMTM